MKIDGRCHCGNISYEAVIEPESVEICHCTDCQTLSGSAFRTVVPTAAEDFKLLTGEPKIYVKTAESGARRAQAFCPECGSPIYSTTVRKRPNVYGLRVGTIRQRDKLPPKSQYWFRSAQHWVSDIGSLRRVEKE